MPVSHDQHAVFLLLGYVFDALAQRDLSKWVLATECRPGVMVGAAGNGVFSPQVESVVMGLFPLKHIRPPN